MGLDQYRTEIIVGLVKREVHRRKKVVFRCNEAYGLKTVKKKGFQITTIEHTEIPRKQDKTDKDVKPCRRIYLFKRSTSDKHPPPE